MLPHPPCGSRPVLNLRPEPNVSIAEEGDRFREVLMAAAPVVDDLWPLDVEAARDLDGIHQIVEVHLPSHGT